MSGFRMVIEMRREQWDAMSPAEQQDLQTLVDETFDPLPAHKDHGFSATLSYVNGEQVYIDNEILWGE